jgi:hypothetical protein
MYNKDHSTEQGKKWLKKPCVLQKFQGGLNRHTLMTPLNIYITITVV